MSRSGLGPLGGWLAWLMVWLWSAVAAAQVATKPPLRAHLTMVGPVERVDAVKPVLVERLGRDDIRATWSAREAFVPGDVLESRGEQDVAAWIDLSDENEAQVYFRDRRAERFFIRALPLPHGLDEVATEEIAHVVGNSVLALGMGTGAALTRAAVREVLQLPPAPPPLPAPRAFRFELSAWVTEQVFAPGIPFVPGGMLGAAIAPAPGRHGFGGWLDAEYRPSTHYRTPQVGLAFESAIVRGGVLWQWAAGRAWAVRLGLGAGVDRVHYRPEATDATVDLAPAATFMVPTARGWTGVDARVGGCWALALRLSADAPLASVHFDLHDSVGRPAQIVVPYSVRPGASLGFACAF